MLLFLGRCTSTPCPHALSPSQSQPTVIPPVIIRHPEIPVPDLCAPPPPPNSYPAPHAFREKCRLKRHTGHVYSVAFSPDGERIVSGSGDKSILVWNWRAQKVILGPLHHKNLVCSTAYSPDGQQIVSGGGDGAVMVWDTKSGERLRQLTKQSHSVRSVAFSPDSRTIASGLNDRTIQIWDAKTGEIVHSMTFSAYVLSIMFSPNGQYHAVGMRNGVEIWDVRSWQRVCGRNSSCFTVAISPDSKQVAYADDKSLCIMDLKTGKPIMDPIQGHTNYIYSLAFSPDGTWIASGSWDESIRIWDTATGNQISKLQTQSWVLSLAISPSGMQIAAGCQDKTIHLYSCDSTL